MLKWNFQTTKLWIAGLIGLVAAVGTADYPVALPLGADALPVAAMELGFIRTGSGGRGIWGWWRGSWWYTYRDGTFCGPILLSISQAQPGRTLSHLSNLSFAKPCRHFRRRRLLDLTAWPVLDNKQTANSGNSLECSTWIKVFPPISLDHSHGKKPKELLKKPSLANATLLSTIAISMCGRHPKSRRAENFADIKCEWFLSILLTRNAQSTCHSTFSAALLFQGTLRCCSAFRGAIICLVAARGLGINLIHLANII